MSIFGVIYGIVASAFVSLNAIFIKKTLPLMNEDIWVLTYYTNLNAFFVCLPIVGMMEASYVAVYQHTNFQANVFVGSVAINHTERWAFLSRLYRRVINETCPNYVGSL